MARGRNTGEVLGVNRTGIGGVTGARYVSVLKKYQLIEYTGARKKGHYKITSKGRVFIDQSVLVKQRPVKEIFEEVVMK